MDPITILPEDQQAIREIQEGIKRERLLLASLENMLVSLLEKKYSIDISKDHWTLDVEAGVLSKEDPHAHE